MPDEKLADVLGITAEVARQVRKEAGDALDLLRRRSDCRKFVRSRIAPRKGRSPGNIVKKLAMAGINGIDDLGKADPAVLREAGLSQKEIEALQAEARREIGERTLKKIGIPPASLRKYLDAGFFTPESLLFVHPLAIAEKTGISPDTVFRHVEAVAQALGKPVPEKVTAARYRRGKEDLLSVPGITPQLYGQLLSAGVYDRQTLHGLDESVISVKSGLPREKVAALRKAAPLTKKKRSGEEIIVI
jgi:DNA topoisomerase-1